MRTTNILLFIIVCQNTISMINTMLKDRLWFKLMNEMKPLLPQITTALGSFFGVGIRKEDGTYN